MHRSRLETISPSISPMEEPSVFTASLSTTNSLSRSPLSSVSRTDIIFVVLAIGSFAFSFLPNTTLPVPASMTTAAFADTCGSFSTAKHPPESVKTNTATAIRQHNFFINIPPKTVFTDYFMQGKIISVLKIEIDAIGHVVICHHFLGKLDIVGIARSACIGRY